MQKFEESNEPLSDRKNIIVMADEAHRGQYGLTEKIKTSKDENGNLIARRTIGTARIIRDSLPNASYIGFTGTRRKPTVCLPSFVRYATKTSNLFPASFTK